MIRAISALAILVVAGGIFFVLNNAPDRQPMLIENAIARPIDDGYSVEFTLTNPGRPDSLVSAVSDMAETVTIVRPGDSTQTPIPGSSAPVFSKDGVYLKLSGFAAPPKDGELLPVELQFIHSDVLSFKARLETGPVVMDHSMMDHSQMSHSDTGPGVAPDIELSVAADPDGDGWNVEVNVADFEFFKPENADAAPEQPGQGHAHLYLDGLKIQRLYGPQAAIGVLAPGRYTIEVGLFSNMHRPVVANGQPVTARTSFEVSE